MGRPALKSGVRPLAPPRMPCYRGRAHGRGQGPAASLPIGQITDNQAAPIQDAALEDKVTPVAAETTGLTGLAGRYAVALYELAEQAGALDAVADDLRSLRDLLAESPELRRLIASPVVQRDAQSRALLTVLERAGAGDLTRRFAGVVAANRRLFVLPAMIEAYLARLAEKRGIVVAKVTSAAQLSEAQVTRLTDNLKRSLGQKIVLDLAVDASLIGGLVVRVGSRLIDSSLKTKLMRLQLAMKGVG